VTFSHLLVGRVPAPQGLAFCLTLSRTPGSAYLSSDVTFSHLLVGRVPAPQGLAFA